MLESGREVIRFVRALRRRDGSAPWRAQSRLIAVLALTCVVGDAVSTGDDLGRSIARGEWAVAGTDLVLLATAAMLVAFTLTWRPRLLAPLLRWMMKWAG